MLFHVFHASVTKKYVTLFKGHAKELNINVLKVRLQSSEI